VIEEETASAKDLEQKVGGHTHILLGLAHNVQKIIKVIDINTWAYSHSQYRFLSLDKIILHCPPKRN